MAENPRHRGIATPGPGGPGVDCVCGARRRVPPRRPLRRGDRDLPRRPAAASRLPLRARHARPRADRDSATTTRRARSSRRPAHRARKPRRDPRPRPDPRTPRPRRRDAPEPRRAGQPSRCPSRPPGRPRAAATSSKSRRHVEEPAPAVVEELEERSSFAPRSGRRRRPRRRVRRCPALQRARAAQPNRVRATRSRSAKRWRNSPSRTCRRST